MRNGSKVFFCLDLKVEKSVAALIGDSYFIIVILSVIPSLSVLRARLLLFGVEKGEEW